MKNETNCSYVVGCLLRFYRTHIGETGRRFSERNRRLKLSESAIGSNTPKGCGDCDPNSSILTDPVTMGTQGLLSCFEGHKSIEKR